MTLGLLAQGRRNQGGKGDSSPPAQNSRGLSPPTTATANWWRLPDTCIIILFYNSSVRKWTFQVNSGLS